MNYETFEQQKTDTVHKHSECVGGVETVQYILLGVHIQQQHQYVCLEYSMVCSCIEKSE